MDGTYSVEDGDSRRPMCLGWDKHTLWRTGTVGGLFALDGTYSVEDGDSRRPVCLGRDILCGGRGQ